MQRGSDRHNPRLDDDLKGEIEPTERANRPTRAHEWRDPEVPEVEPGKDIPLKAGAEDDEAAEDETEDEDRS